ncbi:hypothetical protein GJR95_10665 [Spirosoma endbachense]|uniref:Outer membrane beta-barrel protein n=2 Tax=Spirosoma endbachense TaxID=2666025 RepID=A0A6P1VQ99_9BACT|nr:hypothetical protein GJR95_10665 [Spirosoma endbachense]
MDELDKNIPDDFWRKAFDEASESPPPRVWNAIERRLDESEDSRILPLWGGSLLSSKPFTWGLGVAAAVAVLLVGWWLTGTQPVNQPIARTQRSIQQEQPQTAPDHLATSPVNKPSTHQPARALAAVEKRANNPESTSNPLAIQQKASSITKPAADQPLVAQHFNRPNRSYNPAQEQRFSSRAITKGSGRIKSGLIQQPGQEAASVAFTTSAPASVMSISEADQAQRLIIEKLALRPMKLRSLSGIQRIVWFRPAELPLEPEETKSKRESREVWASVSMMPGSFNPSVSLRSTQTAAFSNASKSSQPTINNRANFSVAYQAGAGVQLSDHWSLESGIGYLSGHSTVESPSQSGGGSTISLVTTATDRASSAGNLYANAVRNSVSIGMLSSASVSNVPKANYDNLAAANGFQNYSNPYQQELANNFEFVQLPIQLGYQLRPHKRLSMALLGGLLTNIFVRNTIGDDLVITGKDGVYRPVSWAASMGARFRYRPSGRWSASLAGMYQPTLGESTRPQSQVQSSPTSAGMSFGLNYHF